MANKSGQAYGLTLLSPILAGTDPSGDPHHMALRAALSEMPNGPQSPLAAVAGTHLARWVVIDDVPFPGVPSHEDHLASRYLLFTACFDGELVPYLEAMRTGMPGWLERIYGHCIGYPGTADSGAFRRYMVSCQLETSFFVAAYGAATLPAVLRALDAQRRMIAFIQSHQGPTWTGDRLQPEFRKFLVQLEQAPTPAPATL